MNKEKEIIIEKDELRHLNEIEKRIVGFECVLIETSKSIYEARLGKRRIYDGVKLKYNLDPEKLYRVDYETGVVEEVDK